MKVLLIHDYYRSSAPSGEDTVFRNEKDLLNNNGLDIVLYERFNDNIDDSTFIDKISLAINGAWSKQTYREVSELIELNKPDIAHFHNTFPLVSPSAYQACQDKGIPVVQTLHNYRLICPGALLMKEGKPCEECVGNTLVPALKNRCYRNSLAATSAIVWMLLYNRWQGTYQKLVNRYIALTEFSASRMAAGGLPLNKISIKPNYLPEISCSFNENRDYALYVGRLTQEKGVKTLIRAWEKVKKIPLKIVGDGALRAELKEEASKKGLNIEFIGYCDKAKVMELLRLAKFQVVPSECYEGFPMVILEAFASGTPVLASRIGSLTEIVQDKVTGLQFEAGNADDLAENANSLIRDEKLANALGKNARIEFESKFTERSNFKKLMVIYAEAVADNLGREAK